MTNVININRDMDVVDAIKELLALAEAGEITSMAYIVSMPDDKTGSGWTGMDKNNLAMLGELRILERDFIDCLIETRIDIETGEYRDE